MSYATSIRDGGKNFLVTFANASRWWRRPQLPASAYKQNSDQQSSYGKDEGEDRHHHQHIRDREWKNRRTRLHEVRGAESPIIGTELPGCKNSGGDLPIAGHGCDFECGRGSCGSLNSTSQPECAVTVLRG